MKSLAVGVRDFKKIIEEVPFCNSCLHVIIGQITHPFPDYLDNIIPELHDNDPKTGHYLLMGSRPDASRIDKGPNYPM